MAVEPELTVSQRGAAELVINRNVDAVNQAFAGLTLPAPAYAACLWLSDDTEYELSSNAVSIALEPDRELASASGLDFYAFDTIWNPGEFAFDQVPVEVVRTPEYRKAEAAIGGALAQSECQGVEIESERWLFIQVARRLTDCHALAPVTDDFLVFLWDGGFELDELRAAATPAVAERLRAKGLLPDAIQDVPGYPDPWP